VKFEFTFRQSHLRTLFIGLVFSTHEQNKHFIIYLRVACKLKFALFVSILSCASKQVYIFFIIITLSTKLGKHGTNVLDEKNIVLEAWDTCYKCVG
jgi:hypothetical protein